MRLSRRYPQPRVEAACRRIHSWHDNLDEPTLADAICDRIVHTALRMELRGEAMRKPLPEHPPSLTDQTLDHHEELDRVANTAQSTRP
jgi:hypothetical protein